VYFSQKNASGEFRRRFFDFAKIWYKDWSRDSTYTTDFEGQELNGQGRGIKNGIHH